MANLPPNDPTKSAIEDAKDWCESVANKTFEEIDILINRLQSLREKVKGECELTNHYLNGFLKLSSDTVKASMAIEQAVEALENHKRNNNTKLNDEQMKQLAGISKE